MSELDERADEAGHARIVVDPDVRRTQRVRRQMHHRRPIATHRRQVLLDLLVRIGVVETARSEDHAGGPHRAQQSDVRRLALRTRSDEQVMTR